MKLISRGLFYLIPLGLMFLCLRVFSEQTDKASFLTGFLCCFVIITVFIVIGKFLKPKHSKNDRSFVLPSLFIVPLIILAYWFISIFQNKISLESKLSSIENNIGLIQLENKNNNDVGLLMSKVLSEARLELKKNKRLSKHSIGQIIDLSQQIKPSRLVINDSLTSHQLSPHRATLLKSILNLDLAHSTYDTIYENASFAYADLEGFSRDSLYLKGVDLSHANLKNAQLKFSNLNKSKLNKCNLWGVELTGSSLVDAQLNRADLSWSILNGIDLSGADLGNAKFENAKAENTNFENSYLKLSFLSGAYMVGANLENTDCYGADMTRTNLKDSNCTLANLRNVNADGTNFHNATLNKAALRGMKLNNTNLTSSVLDSAYVIGEKWIDKLKDYKVIGADKIIAKYTLVSESSFSNNYELISK